jgi:D-amino-acid dehydrogenase
MAIGLKTMLKTMADKKKIVIVGAGIIGLCSAYYLIQEGHQVTILDAASEGAADNCSNVNAGFVSPSHFTPLAAPGVISQGLKWMLDSKSPFYIKPRFSLDLIKWLLLFSKAAKKNRVEAAAPVLLDLNLKSRELFRELHARKELDFDYQELGIHVLYKTEAMKEEEIHLSHKATELGVETKILTAEEVQEQNPNIKCDVIGGVHYLCDSHLQPDLLNKTMIAYLKGAGVEFVYDCRVKDFKINSGAVVSVSDGQKSFEGDEFVLASGAWSQEAAARLNVNIPLQAGKGYNLTIPNAPRQITVPALLCEAKMAISPMGDRLRIGGTMEIAGLNRDVSPNRVQGLMEGIPKFFPEFTEDWVKDVKPWVGLRPLSPDGLPYIGRFKNYKNLTVAAGHAMLGLSLGPVTGQLVSNILSGQKKIVESPLIDADRYN